MEEWEEGMDSRWGWFSLWFFKRTKVTLLLVASLLQYLSALEVNKGHEGGLGWFKLGRFSPLLVSTRRDPQRENELLSPPARPLRGRMAIEKGRGKRSQDSRLALPGFCEKFVHLFHSSLRR